MPIKHHTAGYLAGYMRKTAEALEDLRGGRGAYAFRAGGYGEQAAFDMADAVEKASLENPAWAAEFQRHYNDTFAGMPDHLRAQAAFSAASAPTPQATNPRDRAALRDRFMEAQQSGAPLDTVIPESGAAVTSPAPGTGARQMWAASIALPETLHQTGKYSPWLARQASRIPGAAWAYRNLLGYTPAVAAKGLGGRMLSSALGLGGIYGQMAQAGAYALTPIVNVTTGRKTAGDYERELDAEVRSRAGAGDPTTWAGLSTGEKIKHVGGSMLRNPLAALALPLNYTIANGLIGGNATYVPRIGADDVIDADKFRAVKEQYQRELDAGVRTTPFRNEQDMENQILHDHPELIQRGAAGSFKGTPYHTIEAQREAAGVHDAESEERFAQYQRDLASGKAVPMPVDRTILSADPERAKAQEAEWRERNAVLQKQLWAQYGAGRPAPPPAQQQPVQTAAPAQPAVTQPPAPRAPAPDTAMSRTYAGGDMHDMRRVENNPYAGGGSLPFYIEGAAAPKPPAQPAPKPPEEESQLRRDMRLTGSKPPVGGPGTTTGG